LLGLQTRAQCLEQVDHLATVGPSLLERHDLPAGDLLFDCGEDPLLLFVDELGWIVGGGNGRKVFRTSLMQKTEAANEKASIYRLALAPRVRICPNATMSPNRRYLTALSLNGVLNRMRQFKQKGWRKNDQRMPNHPAICCMKVIVPL
jgi:hypothetical protein